MCKDCRALGNGWDPGGDRWVPKGKGLGIRKREVLEQVPHL